MQPPMQTLNTLAWWYGRFDSWDMDHIYMYGFLNLSNPNSKMEDNNGSNVWQWKLEKWGSSNGYWPEISICLNRVVLDFQCHENIGGKGKRWVKAAEPL